MRLPWQSIRSAHEYGNDHRGWVDDRYGRCDDNSVLLKKICDVLQNISHLLELTPKGIIPSSQIHISVAAILIH